MTAEDALGGSGGAGCINEIDRGVLRLKRTTTADGRNGGRNTGDYQGRGAILEYFPPTGQIQTVAERDADAALRDAGQQRKSGQRRVAVTHRDPVAFSETVFPKQQAATVDGLMYLPDCIVPRSVGENDARVVDPILNQPAVKHSCLLPPEVPREEAGF